MLEIHEIIKKSRKEKGMTQQDLADKIDRSLRMVQKYESGEVEPSIEVLDSMVKVLGDDFAHSLNLNNGRVLYGENDIKVVPASDIDKDFIENIIRSLIFRGEISKTWLQDDDLEFIAELVKDIIIQQNNFLTQKNFDTISGKFNLDFESEDDNESDL